MGLVTPSFKKFIFILSTPFSIFFYLLKQLNIFTCLLCTTLNLLLSAFDIKISNFHVIYLLMFYFPLIFPRLPWGCSFYYTWMFFLHFSLVFLGLAAICLLNFLSKLVCVQENALLWYQDRRVLISRNRSDFIILWYKLLQFFLLYFPASVLLPFST